MAKKKAAARKKCARKVANSVIFTELDDLVKKVSLDYLCSRLDDMSCSGDAGILTNIISGRMTPDQCYLHLMPQKAVVSLVAKIDSLSMREMRSDIISSLGFDVFKQNGLLPKKFCNKRKFSWQDVSEVLNFLYERVGKDYVAPKTDLLRAYAQLKQQAGKYTPLIQASIHPFVVAMTLTGTAGINAPTRRLRNIMLYTLRNDEHVPRLESSDAWQRWKSRHDSCEDSGNQLLLLLKDNIDELFITPSVAEFCLAAENLGEEYRKGLRSVVRSKQENAMYSTEGYQAAQKYFELVEAYKTALFESI